VFLRRIHALWNPECYHGWNKSKKFFEGWYYKIISADQKHALAIIPGIAMDEYGTKQAFIQVLDGRNLKASYHKFDAQDFKPNPKLIHKQLALHFQPQVSSPSSLLT